MIIPTTSPGRPVFIAPIISRVTRPSMQRTATTTAAFTIFIWLFCAIRELRGCTIARAWWDDGGGSGRRTEMLRRKQDKQTRAPAGGWRGWDEGKESHTEETEV